eukprot:CAMPEP_0183712880 /NCGR_PEP_ID=MMETSP0737-20130205/7926_1 /TAXON_ID=385413 /ORGANISM="Thalassiosira miniscula, Strain CCMP1093" /LENGTH=176 /DNA_ID=CAMNT_0025941601 /DNA_START=50 /DNA_END=580 /DNA_ORIENTATION=-
MTSVDEDLAQATSQSLTMGPAIVTNIQGPSVLLPLKLHSSLYNNSLSDVPMSANNSSPPTGFPDFPDCWQGETSKERQIKENNDLEIEMKTWSRRKQKQWKINKARAKRQARRAQRAASNNTTRNAGAGVEKGLKKRQRDLRRKRRAEKAAKTIQKRERRRAMGDICRGLASMNCK